MTLTALLGALTLMCAGGPGGLDARYGVARPQEVESKELAAPPIDYRTSVRPILERRCVVCHGCYDSPCQLKLGALEGILRGASKDRVYDPSRLVAQRPTRLFEDADTTSEWRKLGFFPVVNERADTPAANQDGSLLFQMLRLKKEHPLPQTRRLEEFDFSLSRDQVCPKIEQFEEFEREHPTWGMPYGLPAISESEWTTLTRWVEQGSVSTPRPEIPHDLQKELALWEKFLNGDSNKARLLSRYLYEHWFLGHLYFPSADPGAPSGHESKQESNYFELVRSKTPPGEPVVRIATRRPFGDPQVDRVHYRLVRLRTPILSKNHLPLALTRKRMKRLEELFLTPNYHVDELPGYGHEVSANPFLAFSNLPIQSRYRFLLEDARFIMNGFIKGPVCRGQTSVNVINDRFWVAFLDPELVDERDSRFYAAEGSHLDLPAEESSTTGILFNWMKFSKKEHRFLKAKTQFLNQRFADVPMTMDFIWDGDGRDEDAALTVFRHGDSATVVHGLVGSPPKTSWVLDYSVFERIHYLLVAGFDVFGNVGHQLNTRIYMDFLRMEAESGFLAFLPERSRSAIAASWYEGAEKEIGPFIHGPETTFFRKKSVIETTMNPELVLYEQLRAHLLEVTATVEKKRNRLLADELRGPMTVLKKKLTLLRGGPIKQFPPVSFVRVDGAKEPYYFSILRDNAHSNILSIFNEEKNRRPEEDRLTIVDGLLGAYPNAFFVVDKRHLEAFVKRVVLLEKSADMDELRDDFGMRRTDPRFWDFSDRLHDYERRFDPLEGGLFDYNRLENY